VLYAAGFLLAGAAVLDWAIQAWPLRPRSPEWRFAAFGLLSTFVIAGMLAAVAVAVGAWIRGHGRVLRVVALLCYLLAAILVAGTAVFLLDTIQVLAGVRPEHATTTHLRAGGAALKSLGGALVLGLIGHAAWRRGRILGDPQRHHRGAELVVGQQG
jgi:hypothetical protein